MTNTDFLEELFRRQPSSIEQYVRGIAREVIRAAESAGADLGSLKVQLAVSVAIEKAIVATKQKCKATASTNEPTVS
jgi:hypothetical protein